MQKEAKIKVGISVGDLNGIGCEIIFKTFEDSRMLDFCTPILFACNKTISFQKRQLNSKVSFQGIPDAAKAIDTKINVVNIWRESPKIEYGLVTKEAGTFAIKSLKAATEALKKGTVDVLVTAPIHKHNVQSETFSFPGHTDYLEKELNGKSLMFMIADSLRVGLLTEHIPIKEITQKITVRKIEEKTAAVAESLRKDFGIRKPKIAFLGINPHSGDHGVIGKEEQLILEPAIKAWQEKGEYVYGPYAADGFFGSGNYKNFDAIIATYHDQGLIPFKTLSFGNGVNFTAGLDRIRTSPDHGTAFDIAGKGQADPTSFKEAVFLAIKIFKNRKAQQELTENRLKKHEIGKKINHKLRLKNF